MQNTGPTEGGFRGGIEIGPDGESTGKIVCYPSFDPNCTVVRLPQPGLSSSGGFISLPEPTHFHDAVLMRATKEINQVLLKMAKETEADSRKTSLHLFHSKDGPMLIWVDTMAMPTDDIRKGSSHMKPW
jgi:hypothetical protein